VRNHRFSHLITNSIQCLCRLFRSLILILCHHRCLLTHHSSWNALSEINYPSLPIWLSRLHCLHFNVFILFFLHLWQLVNSPFLIKTLIKYLLRNLHKLWDWPNCWLNHCVSTVYSVWWNSPVFLKLGIKIYYYYFICKAKVSVH
jgi:hypothetical protein